MTFRSRVSAAVVALLTVVTVLTYGTPAQAAPPTMTASALTTLFNNYGDAGNHWTGADGTTSVALPDGRVAWLFSDTFLGTVNADHSRPATTPMINNSMVVQSGTTLGATLTGGTPGAPSSLVPPPTPGEYYWNGDGMVEGGALKVIYNRYRTVGSGALDFTRTGTALATFALPGLTLTSTTELAAGQDISWGAALVPDGSYTYIYGMSSAPGRMTFAHVARAATGSLGGAWQYWNGTSWGSDPNSAARLLSGVGTNYSVQKVGSQYVLVTQDNNLIFDPQFVAYTSSSPTGPWTGPSYLYTAPEPSPGASRIVYDAQLHPALATTGKLLMSYNVNSLSNNDNYTDARIYRPRFVDITWPPVPPTGVPAAPAGLTASGADDYADLSWTALSGATGYRVYQRDVTAGQTHFARQPAVVTTTTYHDGLLIPGHKYEFKISASNAGGEGAAGAVVSTTLHSTKTAATAIVGSTYAGAVAGKYFVRLKGAAGQDDRLSSWAQQLVTQVGGTVDDLLPKTMHGFTALLTPAQAVDLAASPDVLDVGQDQTYTVSGGTQTNPPWHLDRVDQRALPLDNKYTYPQPGAVRVYVIDTGVRPTHQDLAGRVQTGFNAFDRSTNTPDCGGGHGTGVAGMLAGTTYGVAKSAVIVPVKVFNCDVQTNAWVGDGFSIAKGIEWALKDAAGRGPVVFNLSLGGSRFAAGMDNVDYGVQSAVSAGVTVVEAAGNQDGDDACRYSPARMAKNSAAITVAATNGTDTSAGFSNVGSCVTLYAPGSGVTTDWLTSDTATATVDGTSFATPMVAGAAAIVLQAHPGYSPADVKQALVAAATTGKVVGNLGGSPNLLLYVEQPPTVAPTGLTATAKPDGNIGLSWNPVTGPNTQYLISQRDVTGVQATFARWPDPVFGATTATATGLIEGHTYEFTVAAANTAGTSAESNVASAVSHIAPPPAPTGLTATAQADGQIKLSWSSLGSTVWYWVYQRDVTAGETTFTKLAFPVTTTTMTAGYLIDGHTYEYEVSGFNAGGEGPLSAPARAVSDYPPPAPPSGLTATAGNATVNLSWTASATAGVWYWVYQRDVTAGETTFTQLAYPVTTCCSVSLGYLTNNDTYEYKVTAIGTGGESAASNTAQATPTLPLPGAPTGLTAAAGTDGTIKLTWTSPGTDLWFDIWMRDATAGQAFTKLIYPVTTCCTWTASQLTQNHAYEFKVDAINATGAGAQSNVAGATAHYNPPGAPQNLRGRAAGDGTVDLDWDAPGAGGFYYWLYSRDVTAGQTTFTKSVYPTDQTSLSVGPLISGHTYEYKVTAESSGGEGPASAAVQVKSVGGTPVAPSGLTATAGNGQVALRWTASTTASVLYNVYMRDVTAGQSFHKMDLPVSGTSLTVSLLTNGDTFEFKVAAANASGESKASNTASAKPMPPVPAAPSGLTATAGDGTVSLHWTASSTPSVYYLLESRPAGGTWTQARYPISTCCSFSVQYLANGTTYEFRLRATNLAGNSGVSNTASAKPMPPRPTAPSGLTASAGDGKVTLHWTASGTANVYYWVEYASSGSGWQRLKYPVSACCSFTVSGLLDGTTYSFRVLATNLAGDSGASNTASAKPMPPLPSAPGSLRITGQSNDYVAFDWNASTPSNVYYQIQARDTTLGGGWYVAQRYLTLPGIRLYLLNHGSTYQFRVVAENLAGAGPASNVVSTIIPYAIAGIVCDDHGAEGPFGLPTGWSNIYMSIHGVSNKPNSTVHMTQQMRWEGHGIYSTGYSDLPTDGNGRYSFTWPPRELGGGTYHADFQVYVNGVAQPTVTAQCTASP